MREITKAELKKRIGVRSDTTLRNWVSAGLIPKPMIKRSPTGRGTSAYYPMDIVERCLEIKRLTGEGMTLPEVRDLILSGDKTKPPGKNSRSRSTSIKKKQTLVELGSRRIWIADRVAKESKKLARVIRDTRAPKLITDELIEDAARLARDGHPPVLVIGLERSLVIADYSAGVFFAKHPEAIAVLMIPLRELFVTELSNATRELSPLEKANKREVTIDSEGNRKLSDIEVIDGQPITGAFLRCIDLD